MDGATLNGVERIGLGCAILCALCVGPGFSQALPPLSQPLPGTINGVVADKSGAIVSGAKIIISREDSVVAADAVSGADGRFSFGNVLPGRFRLTVSVPGFSDYSMEANLNPGEILNLPPAELVVSIVVGNVEVKRSKEELAEEQIKKEEHQRLLGFLPDFHISFVPDAVPLTAKQKFELSWKSTIDPVTFVLTGLIAGVEQKQNDYKAFGQGAQGYASRFGASYASFFTRAMVSEAALPALFKQDPRYFYKGTGSTGSRIVYALTRAVVRKGDNGSWQPNYSGVLGNFITGGVSDLYYPGTRHRWGRSILVGGGINIGTNASVNLLKEFLFKKLTPEARKVDGIQPLKVTN
jgi:hypothetical protein